MKFFRSFLQSLGALSLILLGLLAIYFVTAGWSSKKITDKDDARFVLNWGGLSTDQDWSIIAGSASPRNITGDHTDYYCIQLQDISINQQNPIEWQAGPELLLQPATKHLFYVSFDT